MPLVTVDDGGAPAPAAVTATVVGADVGGTKVSAVLLSEQGEVCHQSWVEYRPTGFDGIIDALVGAVGGASEAATTMGKKVGAVGVALAAWLSPDRESVIMGANIGARHEPLSAELGRRLGLPVVLENDGNATALAESRAAGARSGCCVVFTLGTGVGGGVVVDDRLVMGGSGLAGELGHIAFNPAGARCVCGGRGCLELVASGPGITSAAGARDSTEVVARARSGDELARGVLHEAGRAIGQAVKMLVPVIAPHLVVLSGSIGYAAADYLLPGVRSALAEERPLSAVSAPPEVELGRVGPYAGAIGAAHLALAQL